jgi:hypothetical protein
MIELCVCVEGGGGVSGVGDVGVVWSVGVDVGMDDGSYNLSLMWR